MVIKHIIQAIIVLIQISTLSALTLDTVPYQNQANEWAKSYVVSSSNNKIQMSQHDLQIVANLLYFSFLRSAITIEAQGIACNALETVWHGWQNISQTRMNPSLQTPYPVNFNDQHQLFQEFIEAQYFHRTIGTTYAHCAETAVKQKVLANHAQKAVDDLREQARIVVANSLLDIKKILGELYDFASQHVRADASDSDDTNRFDIMNTISQYFALYSMQSFIEAERINTQASEQSWQITHTITDVSRQIWHAIETARASFYLAHYQTLIKIMQEHAIDQTYQYIMFDENGIISSSDQSQLLPDINQ